MNAQAQLFGAAGRTDDDQVLSDLEVDYTPLPVAVQLLLTMERDLVREPRILLPACGSGCWARAARAVFPRAHLVGVEPRESEAANVAAACDESFVGTLEEYIAQRSESFGLIVDNPPFSAFKRFWPSLLLAGGQVAQGGYVAFYGLSQWGQSAEAAAGLRQWSPSRQVRLGGRPAHREDGKTDAREYSLWVWDEGDQRDQGPRRVRHAGSRAGRPRWMCEQLPELPLDMRRWLPSAVPGTYPVEPALVDEIRRGYL